MGGLINLLDAMVSFYLPSSSLGSEHSRTLLNGGLWVTCAPQDRQRFTSDNKNAAVIRKLPNSFLPSSNPTPSSLILLQRLETPINSPPVPHFSSICPLHSSSYDIWGKVRIYSLTTLAFQWSMTAMFLITTRMSHRYNEDLKLNEFGEKKSWFYHNVSLKDQLGNMPIHLLAKS